jgi:polyhydroxybutyrate depolymerase
MRFTRPAAAVALAAALTAGCRAGENPTPPPPDIPSGSSTHEITVDGQRRTYRLYIPATRPAPMPLVVMLHGGFGSGRQAEAAYGWDAQADANRFVVAFPDGADRAWAVGGGCCGSPGRTGVDDAAFVVQMVDAISARLPIDPARVYATGMSNGAMMAYRLACDTDRFAAIAPVAGTLLGSCPTRPPTSVLHVHGAADRNVRYDGGPGEGRAVIDGPPVPEVIAGWRDAMGCAAPVESTDAAVTRSRADCPDGRAVELITIAGAGHQWPGAERRPGAERLLGTDPPSTALDATATIWRFFAQHPR